MSAAAPAPTSLENTEQVDFDTSTDASNQGPYSQEVETMEGHDTDTVASLTKPKAKSSSPALCKRLLSVVRTLPKVLKYVTSFAIIMTFVITWQSSIGTKKEADKSLMLTEWQDCHDYPVST